jgi:hypothetical protein
MIESKETSKQREAGASSSPATWGMVVFWGAILALMLLPAALDGVFYHQFLARAGKGLLSGLWVGSMVKYVLSPIGLLMRGMMVAGPLLLILICAAIARRA